jgi:hypothetical protein
MLPCPRVPGRNRHPTRILNSVKRAGTCCCWSPLSGSSASGNGAHLCRATHSSSKKNLRAFLTPSVGGMYSPLATANAVHTAAQYPTSSNWRHCLWLSLLTTINAFNVSKSIYLTKLGKSSTRSMLAAIV